jgi:hypothetical protein
MQSVDKKYFLFNKGINTEAPLAAWPEGFTVDEQNFDLLQDGSRRRRLGLSYEAGEATSYFTCESVSTLTNDGTKYYRWKNVNNTDEVNLLVMQIGSAVYFWNDPISGPLGVYIGKLDLLPFKVQWDETDLDAAYAAEDSKIQESPVSFSEMEGKLIIAGEHIETLVIEYDVDIGFVTKTFQFKERDMFGIDDGILLDQMPTEMTPEHQYNLFNRGWEAEKITQFYDEQTKYPSKNMIQFMGMRRQTEKGYSDDDGVKIFSPDKLMEEFFSNMSAPQGHITRNPFNRRYNVGTLGQGTAVTQIAWIDLSNFEAHADMKITTSLAEHGLVEGDEVFLSGVKIQMWRGAPKIWDFTGTHKVAYVVDAVTFSVNFHSYFDTRDWHNATVKERGGYSTDGVIKVNFAGTEPCKTRFPLVTSFSGRLFYGGCPDSRLADRVYFSKVIETDSDLGKCFQEADPTSEYISDLIPTDGGYITIPNLGILKGFLAYGRSLIIFSSEGVWSIGPGEGGMFSASGYSVNKISSAGCLSSHSILLVDNVPMYWSNAGIYAIMEDSNSGFLSATNVTQDTINGLFHAVRYDEKTRVKSSYDPIRKRAFFLYNSRLVNPATGNPPLVGDAGEYSTSVTPMGVLDDTDAVEVVYDTALIFDARLGAWTKWVFGDSTRKIRDMFCLSTNYSTDNLNGGIRFLCQEQGTQQFYMGELTNTLYEDWGTESPAFVYTGPDSLGEPERFKYAPYVHVFMRKETPIPTVVDQTPDQDVEYTVGNSVDLVLSGRASSVLMQPRWDWARGADSGKITSYVQVFREVKLHPDSFGVVVTKNKVRGRGRNLFLAFKAGEKSPAWIDGWTIKYDAQVRI